MAQALLPGRIAWGLLRTHTASLSTTRSPRNAPFAADLRNPTHRHATIRVAAARLTSPRCLLAPRRNTYHSYRRAGSYVLTRAKRAQNINDDDDDDDTGKDCQTKRLEDSPAPSPRHDSSSPTKEERGSSKKVTLAVVIVTFSATILLVAWGMGIPPPPFLGPAPTITTVALLARAGVITNHLGASLHVVRWCLCFDEKTSLQVRLNRAKGLKKRATIWDTWIKLSSQALTSAPIQRGNS